MRLIYVRHGEPDYANDCLTETGRQQAIAVSKRLQKEGISEIYTSPMGRASQTASYTSELLDIPIQTMDYMHEITWGGPDIPAGGHPWTLSDRMIDEDDFDYYDIGWRDHPYFAHNAATDCYDEISARIDIFLEEHGYRHEGTRFMCETGEDKTIAIFGHGGSGACTLAHILALPFPYVLTVMPYEFTAVIILEFPVRMGEYVHPRIELFNDAAHIRGISRGLVIQKDVD
ncbi:MAG: histidine phosphatase family protein [Lachnospiraceae bacterium]|nr:histidine phosphatase family protein [Lachnospiraceae bacterium]